MKRRGAVSARLPRWRDCQRGGGDPRGVRGQQREQHPGSQADHRAHDRGRRRTDDRGERSAPRQRTARHDRDDRGERARRRHLGASTTGSAAAPTTAASAAAAHRAGQAGREHPHRHARRGEARSTPSSPRESEGDWRVKMLFDQLVTPQAGHLRAEARPREVVEDRGPHLHLHPAG